MLGELKFVDSPSEFLFQPFSSDPHANLPTLRIDKNSKEIKVNDEAAITSIKKVEGILGVFKLITGYYLAVISYSQSVGSLLDKEVKQINKIQLLPYKEEPKAQRMRRPSTSDDTEGLGKYKAFSVIQKAFPLPSIDTNTKQPLVETETKILLEINRLFATGTFYFSQEIDLTRRVQAMGNNILSFDQNGTCLMEKQFWWNEFITLDFIEKGYSAWITPVIQGFAKFSKVPILGEDVNFGVISRRSKLRAGLRYQRRGIDKDGNCANFVETEQILNCHGSTMSFVQTRGSIPLYWSQKGINPKPKPILLKDAAENMDAMKLHFDSQMKRYGTQIALSLVEKTGRESLIGNQYSKYIEELSHEKVKLHDFDFHEECKGLKYENVNNLLQEVEKEMNNVLYYWKSPEGDEFITQQGVFRTNCMDCLDRTNVVQTAIAREVAYNQLMKLGILGSPEMKSDNLFDKCFNKTWGENGDYISRAYSGTGAMKTDFVKLGRRTKRGVVNDGVKSVVRMYKNYFKDGFRQILIDYILGTHKVDVFVKYNASGSKLETVEQIENGAVGLTANLIIPKEGEEFIKGWVVSAFENYKADNMRSVDRVLILTDKSYYLCDFQYDLGEVVQYQKVPLTEIKSLKKVVFENGEQGIQVNYSSSEKIVLQNLSLIDLPLEQDSTENSNEQGEKFHLITSEQENEQDREKNKLQMDEIVKAFREYSKTQTTSSQEIIENLFKGNIPKISNLAPSSLFSSLKKQASSISKRNSFIGEQSEDDKPVASSPVASSPVLSHISQVDMADDWPFSSASASDSDLFSPAEDLISFDSDDE